jgi:HEPN domain-containing protein
MITLGRCLGLQSRHKDICHAFMLDAQEDLLASEVLLKSNIFSKSVYHSQQVVEKCLKAVLSLNGIMITDDHVVSDRFSLLFSRFNQVATVIDYAKALERHGMRPKYPLFGDPIKPIWIPSREYRKIDASQSFDKAVFVMGRIKKFINEIYRIRV